MNTSKIGNLWQATNREEFASAALGHDTSTELIIIGGGFTGCSAALHAARAGKGVVLLEAQTIGFGGSGRNVGLVNAGLWMPPDQVEAALGNEAGRKLNTVLAGAPELVFSLIEEHEIQCEPVRNGTLHCAHSKAGMHDLENRYRQIVDRGGPVTLFDREETVRRTGSSRFFGSLHDARAGTIHPLAYCTGLARAASEAGAVIHAHSPVTRIERRADRWIVKTPSGSVSGTALLVATNAYQEGLSGIPAPEFIPVHYFQLATQPLPSNLGSSVLPQQEGCWDTATVMSSFRRDRDGRLIIGAIGSLDHGVSAVHRHWARRKLARLFPDLSDQPLDYGWCGRIAMTSDHLPKIVRLGPNALSIFGYSGRGIGPGTVFGTKASAALTGEEEDVLPISPVRHHTEAFSRVKAVVYEAGAGLFHAARP
jgi:glycine/D-amino acid oxidase-like deaminating enzyme